MSKPSNPTLIGSFVIGAVLLLVTAVLLFGGAALFSSKRVLVSYFPGSVKACVSLQRGAQWGARRICEGYAVAG